MDFLELKNKLSSGDFDALIGVVEDEHFDAKSGKYDISGDGGKLEFAKDVSSFANRSGGIIVIGARTAEDPAFFGRRVESISPLLFAAINPTDYHNVIKDWIYPRPNGIEIEWAQSRSDPERGLFYVFVPNQLQDPRPFVIRKDVDPVTNLKRKEILFGLAERVSHSSDPYTVERIHTLLRYGRENRWREEVANRLAAIEFTLSEPPKDKERRRNLDEIVKTRIGDSIGAGGLGPYRAYALAMSPLDQAEVQTFLSSASDSIAKHLENPPQLRRGGWDMYTGGRAILASGDLRRIQGDDKIVDLWRDGTLVSVFRGDQVLLGWGPGFGNTRINPLTLVESTYMFFNFYELILAKLNPPAEKLNAWWFFRNLHQDSQVTTLAPGPIEQTSGRGYHDHPAPTDSISMRIQVAAPDFSATKVSVEVLREIYGWFGIDEDRIPYLTEDRATVNVEMIKRITH